MKALRPILIAATLLALAALACSGLPQLSAPPTAVPLPTLPPAVITPPTVAPADPTAPIQPVVLDPAAEQQLYIDLYRRVNPAVVAILVFHADGIEMGLGTGFVIDKEGVLRYVRVTDPRGLVPNDEILEVLAKLK